MKTYRELVAAARAATTPVTLVEMKRRLDAQEPMILVDVREPGETAEGTLPGALPLPRGLLEGKIESAVPDRSARVVTYCGGGGRAALAAASLVELGYTNVEAAGEGFRQWRELGFPVEGGDVAAAPSLAPRGETVFGDAQRARYARHLALAEIGEAGQRTLLSKKVLVLGAGGLGSPAALYLAAAGVGTIGLVDADVVDASNLQRQVLHATSRLGASKVASGAERLADLNPDVRVVPHAERLTSANVERILAPYDVVVDGTDNFATRYLVNDAGVWLGKPVVHAAVSRFEGQLTTFVSDRAAAAMGVPSGPCYRCLYPAPPPAELAPSCAEDGVLGVVPGVLGVLQANEALKLLLGLGDALVGRLLTYDAKATRFRELRLPRAPDCPVCSPTATITTYVDYDAFCRAAGRNP